MRGRGKINGEFAANCEQGKQCAFIGSKNLSPGAQAVIIMA
jgi:hypothetical protein